MCFNITQFSIQSHTLLGYKHKNNQVLTLLYDWEPILSNFGRTEYSIRTCNGNIKEYVVGMILSLMKLY